ncbi:hypothetical protein EMPS_10190 [Entomortierella parvispora]|uniref:AB hydrolase-1 domain-containing protein n=1 Tax=Entomortierella parvispora TaxID=205924 RepID=A0A9P3M0S2_9FUNG|nr:hypothetical protein EMPS_10190 [Entomortierella parvispora]
MNPSIPLAVSPPTDNSTVSPFFEKGHIVAGQSRKKSIKLYYEKTGAGPLLLLFVMGLNSPGCAGESVVAEFAKKPEYTIATFDNRGVGFSDSPSGIYSTSQMAQDTLDLLDGLQWKEKVHVVGTSLGGMISLELVLKDPTRFASLCLVSTNAGRALPPFSALSFVSRVSTVKAESRPLVIVQTLFPQVWLEKPAPEGSNYKTNQEHTIAGIEKMFRDRPPQTIQGSMGQTMAAGLHYVSPKRLSMIRASGLPVLVMTGTDDKMVSPEGSYHLQKELGSHMVVFEGTGHGIAMEYPETYCRLIDELVRHGNNGRFEL